MEACRTLSEAILAGIGELGFRPQALWLLGDRPSVSNHAMKQAGSEVYARHVAWPRLAEPSERVPALEPGCVIDGMEAALFASARRHRIPVVSVIAFYEPGWQARSLVEALASGSTLGRAPWRDWVQESSAGKVEGDLVERMSALRTSVPPFAREALSSLYM